MTQPSPHPQHARLELLPGGLELPHLRVEPDRVLDVQPVLIEIRSGHDLAEDDEAEALGVD